jgi:hypothetical protein
MRPAEKRARELSRFFTMVAVSDACTCFVASANGSGCGGRAFVPGPCQHGIMSASVSAMRSQADIGQALLMNWIQKYAALVQPAPGLAAAEHAAEGTALNPQAIRALQRDC